jgi:hypothetical protein
LMSPAIFLLGFLGIISAFIGYLSFLTYLVFPVFLLEFYVLACILIQLNSLLKKKEV